MQQLIHLAVSSDNISNKIIEKEKEIYTEQAKKTNKPAEIIEKMVEGRLKKFFKENVLIEQDFVKDPNKTIKDIITDTVGKLGENIVITRFKRFQLENRIKKFFYKFLCHIKEFY